jgi:hypothetical protein
MSYSNPKNRIQAAKERAAKTEIEAGLKEARGVVRQAALLLGVTENNMWAYMKRYAVRSSRQESPGVFEEARQAKLKEQAKVKADDLLDSLLEE